MSEPSGVQWREYVDLRFSTGERAVAAALAAAEKAVLKAENAADKRFESVNEFRAALADKDRLQMPRTEAAREFAALKEKIDKLEPVGRRFEPNPRAPAVHDYGQERRRREEDPVTNQDGVSNVQTDQARRRRHRSS